MRTWLRPASKKPKHTQQFDLDTQWHVLQNNPTFSKQFYEFIDKPIMYSSGARSKEKSFCDIFFFAQIIL